MEFEIKQNNIEIFLQKYERDFRKSFHLSVNEFGKFNNPNFIYLSSIFFNDFRNLGEEVDKIIFISKVDLNDVSLIQKVIYKVENFDSLYKVLIKSETENEFKDYNYLLKYEEKEYEFKVKNKIIEK